VPFSRTEPNVPGFTEDANSPIKGTQQTSVSFSFAGNFDQVIIFPTAQTRGFNSIRVNGNTGNNYNVLRRGGGLDIGIDSVPIVSRTKQLTVLRLQSNPVDVGVNIDISMGSANQDDAASAELKGSTSAIDSITFFSSGGFSRTFEARVFGLTL